MAPGRWPVVFLLERTGQAGSCRCQEKHYQCQPGRTVKSKASDQFFITEGSLMIKKKKHALSSCNYVFVFYRCSMDKLCASWVL